MPSPLLAPLLAFAGRLRFPILFGLTLGLWLLTLVLPDPLPFLDELVLGLAVLLLSRWRKPAMPPAGAGVTLEGQARRE